MYIIIFLALFLGVRFATSWKYRFYYISTAFISVRLWIMTFSAIYFASNKDWLGELEIFSVPSTEVTIFLSFFAIFLLSVEYFASKYLFSLKRTRLKINMDSFYIRYLSLFILIYFICTLYMLLELINLPKVGGDVSFTKFNYTNFVTFPIIYKVIYALLPALILIISYGFSISNYYKTFKIKRSLSPAIFLIFVSGLIFHTFVYGLSQTKSHFIIFYILYFLAPIMIFNKSANISFFKNKILFLGFLFSALSLVFITFLVNYGDEFQELLLRRLTLEGQLFYVSIRDFNFSAIKDSYLDTLFNPGDQSAITYLMYKYAPQYLLERYELSGWTMSGAMPGYIFMFRDFGFVLTIWIFNLGLISTFLFYGFKNYMHGKLITSFLFLKLSWYAALYVSQGHNYLINTKFWIIMISLIIVMIIKYQYHLLRLNPKVRT